MRKITSAATAAVLALALTAGACGGGSDDDAADTSTDGTTTTAGGGDGGTAPGSPDLSGLVPEECQFLLAGAFVNPLAAAVPGADADFEASAEQLDAIAAKAPDDIQDAMKTLAEGYAAFAEALKDVDLSDPQAFADPEVLAKFESVEDVFDADYEAAGQKVSDYVEQNCSG